MAREERSSRTWISMVTLVWVVFGLAVIGLILWYGGIIGGTPGNGDVTAITQENGDNGNGADDGDAEADADGNGEDVAAEDGDAEADANGNGEGNGEANGDAEADANGNGEDAAEENGNGDDRIAVFTSEQAERGEESYSQNCAQCHGGQLDGDPPLSGSGFASTWEGMPVNALFEVISQTMPQDSPGSLDQETYEDVTAHILAFNGMPDGESELQAGESESMETLISFDSADGENGEAVADANGEQTANGDTSTENGGDAGNGEAADANGEQDNGEASGAESGNGNGETGEEAAAALEVEETAEGQPGAGEGWIDLTVEPQTATVNVLGPAGFVGQLQGADGTITGLEPGSYVFTASLGNFSDRVDAEVTAHETVAVNLLITELAGSPDLDGQAQANGAQNGAESGEQNGNGSDAGSENGDAADENGDTGGNGNGNDESGNGENGENGDDAWYTDEQADAGAEDYSASCASCHGEEGSGGSDPPLVDGAIEGSFDTVWDLYDYTATEMPDDDPGALDEETYVNIIAHILALNDYPSGDEELEADEDQMSDMSLDDGGGSGNGNGQANGNGQNGNGAAAEDGNGEDAGTGENGEAAAEEENGAADEGSSAQRGASIYSNSCAMCHGQTMHGIDAPPLAGPVFLERWGGHPVEWLYFQAHTSMPPDSPGSLDDQDYVDVIVHILAENGFLEGDEEFVPDDLLLRSMIIGTPDQQDATLEMRIDELRRTLHDPFEEAEAEDPEAGADEIGVPVTPDPESPVETDDGEAQNGENGQEESNGGNGEEEDAETDGDFTDEAIMEDDSEVPPAGLEEIDDTEGEGGEGE